MRRFLLVFLLAAIVLGILAAPAFAAPAPSLQAPFHAAFIVPNKMGGVWLEATGDVNAPTLVPHLAGHAHPGRLRRLPRLAVAQHHPGPLPDGSSALLYQVKIDGLGVDVSPAEAMAYWSGPVLWDAYWSGLLGPIPAFNASIGAPAYANHWWLPLTGDASVATVNLTAGKKLAPGTTYAGVYTEIVTRTITDLRVDTPRIRRPRRSASRAATSWDFTFKVACAVT